MKHILILGGTRFFGRKLVDLLLSENHQVTIITRGQSGNPFGSQVEHIQVDRLDKKALAASMEGRTFDIVYDNICYSPKEAYDFCEVFNGKIKKLVFTSTLSTYEPDGQVKKESDFDPYQYEIVMGEKEKFSYGEGKRQAEAVFFKYAQFPVVAVRFPIVMGEDDYTRRLHFHVERIAKNEPIVFVNMDAEMGFIQAGEAAQFLHWVGLTAVEGPYNAVATGRISMKSLIALIEEATGNTAKIIVNGDDDLTSPYAVPQSWYMSNEKATNAGFTFSHLDEWLKPLIEKLAQGVKTSQ